MPAAIHADWSQVRDTAVALQSIKLAAQEHGVPYEAARMRASREKWPVGQRLAKVITDAKQVHASAVAKANPNAVTSVTSTSDVLQKQLEAGHNPAILSLKEKREYLASIVRTPIGEVDESSALAQKVKRSTRRDKYGGETETEEIELPNKLRAVELDARLAGELEGDHGDRRVMINIGILNE
jgi:hypothetical protein